MISRCFYRSNDRSKNGQELHRKMRFAAKFEGLGSEMGARSFYIWPLIYCHTNV